MAEKDQSGEYETVYEFLGGEDGVDRVASSLYARLVMDEEFGPALTSTNADAGQLLRHQRNFISHALGGPCKHSLEDLRANCAAIIRAFDFSPPHCEIMMARLQEILTELKVPGSELPKVMEGVRNSLHKDPA